jgi:hypothetical protein
MQKVKEILGIKSQAGHGRLAGRPSLLLIVGIWMSLPVHSARAADTVETWDVGATDVDFYLGFDGIGRARYERSVYGDMMLGYGLVDRLSAYVGTTLSGIELFSDGSADLYVGIFGTPLDTDHFDLDFFLDVGAGGPEFSAFTVTPAIEVNVDIEPDRALLGMYGCVGVPLFGRPTEDDPTEHVFVADVVTTVGTYLTILEHHQLLLEYDMLFRTRLAEGEDTVEVGGVALGYNVVAHDAIELINQVYLDIPRSGEPVAVGFMVGFIATLPSAP